MFRISCFVFRISYFVFCILLTKWELTVWSPSHLGLPHSIRVSPFYIADSWTTAWCSGTLDPFSQSEHVLFGTHNWKKLPNRPKGLHQFALSSIFRTWVTPVDLILESWARVPLVLIPPGPSYGVLPIQPPVGQYGRRESQLDPP
jgi:hypothetical protein